MKIRLDFRKSALQNAQTLFYEAKKFKRKVEGAKKAIEETKRKLSMQSHPGVAGKPTNKSKAKKKWFDEFRHFTTSNGFSCAGGKNAKQNDTLVASQLKEGDLFFHADVHGASAVVLKNGLKAGEKDLREAVLFERMEVGQRGCGRLLRFPRAGFEALARRVRGKGRVPDFGRKALVQERGTEDCFGFGRWRIAGGSGCGRGRKSRLRFPGSGREKQGRIVLAAEKTLCAEEERRVFLAIAGQRRST